VGLVLYGDNGTGKSGMAAVIAEAMIRRGVAVLFIDYHEFVGAVQGEYKPDGDSEGVLGEAMRVPFLVLDDLGDIELGLNATTFDKQTIIYRLINMRHKARKPTVITTNLLETQLELQFNKRTWQRIKEICLVVAVRGVNLREETI
jgi:DNA replication protein DnaC